MSLPRPSLWCPSLLHAAACDAPSPAGSWPRRQLPPPPPPPCLDSVVTRSEGALATTGSGFLFLDFQNGSATRHMLMLHQILQ